MTDPYDEVMLYVLLPRRKIKKYIFQGVKELVQYVYGKVVPPEVVSPTTGTWPDVAGFCYGPLSSWPRLPPPSVCRLNINVLTDWSYLSSQHSYCSITIVGYRGRHTSWLSSTCYTFLSSPEGSGCRRDRAERTSVSRCSLYFYPSIYLFGLLERFDIFQLIKGKCHRCGHSSTSPSLEQLVGSTAWKVDSWARNSTCFNLYKN